MCHFFERGRCLKGERCNHAHGPEDLREPKSKDPWMNMPEVATPGRQASHPLDPLEAELPRLKSTGHNLSAWGMPWALGAGFATPESYYLGPSPQQLRPLQTEVADEATWTEDIQVEPCDLSKRLASLDAVCTDFSADVRHWAEAADPPSQRRIHRI
eukprot:g27898.t1